MLVPMESLKTNLDDVYARAVEYLQSGQLSLAEQSFLEVLTREPRHIESLNYLSLIAFKKSDWQSALAYLSKAATATPDDPALWNNMGVVNNAATNYQEAKTALEKALELRPDYPEAWNNLGIALHRLDREANAVHCFQKAIALKPDYPEAFNN